MSDGAASRAAELAAQQVESIVAAAQQAAEGLKEEAQREAAQKRRDAERDAGTTRTEARDEASKWLDIARREADEITAEARKQSGERVANAQEAADEMLGNAKTVATGLRRLGESLSDQADRILRDVHAAHKQMTGDLRIASAGPGPEPRAAAERLRRERAAEREPARDREGRPATSPDSSEDQERIEAILSAERSRGRKPTGLDDLDVPNWVEPES